MRWRTRLIVLGYPLVELVTLYLVAQWIGWGWALLLLIAGIPAGIAIMRNAGSSAMADLQRSATAGEPFDQARHAFALLGGLLIAVPGFWTDLIGILVLLPFTQRWLRPRASAWATARMSVLRMPGIYDPRGYPGDVIQGTVIVDDLREPRERSAGSDVRGELPPADDQNRPAP